MKKKAKEKKESRLSRFINDNIYIITAFMCTAVLMLVVYFCNDVIPFGNKTVLRMDLFHQYGPLFAELFDRIKGLKSFAYSWTSGGGSSFLGNYYNYLSSPVAIIILAFGHERIPEAIGAMVLIKCALSASTMAYYLKKTFNRNDFTITAFGIMYAFCGFFVAYYWNIMWIDAMYLLPLVVLGIQKLIDENKAKLYVVSLFITFIANYYMAFMVCVFALIYYFVYYFSNHSLTGRTAELKKYVDKNGKVKTKTFDTIKKSLFINRSVVFGVCSLLAAALAAFALLPTFIILTNCSATSGVMPEELSTYNVVFDFLANHLASVEPTIRSSGDLVLPNVYSGMLTLVLLPLFYFCKKISVPEKVMTTLTLGFFFLCFNFNIPNYIIHAFHFPNDLPFRFSFIYSFFIIITAYKVLMNIREFSGKELLAAGLAVIVFIILVEVKGQANVDENTVLISIVFTVAYTFVLWLFKNPSYHQPTVAILLMCCVFAEAAVAETERFEITQEKPNFVNGYEDFVKLKKEIDKRENDGFYRMELTELNTLMDNCWFGYNGMSMFSSMAYESFANMQDDLGIKSNYINSFVYNKNTPVYDAMMGLKYIVSNNDTKLNPDYYEFVASCGKFTAYENKYSLPLAYCANKILKDWHSSDFGNPFTNQTEYIEFATGVKDLFTAVDVSDSSFENINETDSFFTGMLFNFVKESYGEEATANVTYVLPEDGNVFAYVDSDELEEATITCGEFNLTQDLSEAYIVDLGYHKANETVEINMPISEGNDNGSIECYVYTLNEENFKKSYDILKANAMKFDSFEETSMSGRVTAPENSVLYTSIPYDKGWQVTVDGKKADTFELSDKALLGVNLTAGEHTVEFSYHVRGLFVGVCISAGALLFIILFLIFRKIALKIKDRKKAVYFSAVKPEDAKGIDDLLAKMPVSEDSASAQSEEPFVVELKDIVPPEADGADAESSRGEE